LAFQSAFAILWSAISSKAASNSSGSHPRSSAIARRFPVECPERMIEGIWETEVPFLGQFGVAVGR